MDTEHSWSNLNARKVSNNGMKILSYWEHWFKTLQLWNMPRQHTSLKWINHGSLSHLWTNYKATSVVLKELPRILNQKQSMCTQKPRYSQNGQSSMILRLLNEQSRVQESLLINMRSRRL